MKTVKEKGIITFYLDDGKTIQYDLNTKETIGKLGKPVQYLTSQLKGFTVDDILESIEDEKFRQLFEFTSSLTTNRTPARIINNLNQFTHLEKYFNVGLNVSTISYPHPNQNLPKWVIPILKEYNLDVTDTLLFALDEFSSIDVMNSILHDGYIYPNNFKKELIVDWGIYTSFRYTNKKILELHETYNYNIKSLFLYYEKLSLLEGLNDIGFITRELMDYNRMMSAISPVKYDKYPRNFLTTMHITIRNYNRNKEKYDEIIFKNQVDSSLNTTIGEFIFITPTCTQDVKDEGVSQNNCVSSYIPNIIDGRCQIVFMRNSKTPNKSLVTVEVVNNEVVQAKQAYNSKLTQTQSEVIEKYNDYLKNRK